MLDFSGHALPWEEHPCPLLSHAHPSAGTEPGHTRHKPPGHGLQLPWAGLEPREHLAPWDQLDGPLPVPELVGRRGPQAARTR